MESPAFFLPLCIVRTLRVWKIPLIPPKATLAVTKSRPVRPDVCSQMVWIPVVISKSPIRAGFKITGPGRGSLKRDRDKMENSMIDSPIFSIVSRQLIRCSSREKEEMGAV